MRRLFTTLLGALCLIPLGLPAVANEGLGCKGTTVPAQWTIEYQGKPLMTYAFPPGTYKPYVKELCTIDGRNILRDSPADHLHHHALMYAIKVNGVNFWEEIAGSGIEKPIETSSPKIIQDASGRPQAVITQTLHWLAVEDAFLPNTNAQPLLVEYRTLTLTVDERQKEVSLRWHSRFVVGSKTNQVALTGANYHGLGMRFQKELDAFARHVTSQGELSLPGAQQDVSAHPWEGVTFNHPDSPATVVLFGNSANARGNSQFFAMRSPFAYLSATQALDREPLVYQSGQSFELEYVVAVYSSVMNPSSISERVREWPAGR